MKHKRDFYDLNPLLFFYLGERDQQANQRRASSLCYAMIDPVGSLILKWTMTHPTLVLCLQVPPHLACQEQENLLRSTPTIWGTTNAPSEYGGVNFDVTWKM